MSATIAPPAQAGTGPLVADPEVDRRWWVRPGRPVWSVPARAGIAVLATVLYTVNLSVNGLGNTFYSAAVLSGTESWKAFLFGSLDPGNFITVDKPPAALWVQELSARIFGFSSWSLLLPEALAGVASVLVLYHLVRRWMGEVAAVLASLALALTPVAVLMFRYNNPDAVLTLLLLLSAWALWSALESAATVKLVAAGGLLGLAFTTKMLQAFVVVPAFALVYLICGRPQLGRRIVQLLWGALALVVSSGWWVAVVELWPAASRPYVGGSTDNSELNLIFGYNGFGRLLGSGSGPGGGGGPGGGAGFGGTAGALRMFNDIVGGEIAWLLPLALVGLVAGLWWTRRAPRTDLARAGFVLWGGWALCTMAVFSETQGIFHPYYTVALAPGVAALAGGGSVALWRLGRDSVRWGAVLPVAVLGSAIWAAVLLDRTPGFDQGLSTVIVVGGAVSAIGLALVLFRAVRLPWLAVAAGSLAAATLLAGPAAYAATTMGQASSGGVVSAGPLSGQVGGPGGGPGGAFGAAGPPGATSADGLPGAGGSAGVGTSAETGLDAYLVDHRAQATYLVAVDGASSAEPIILATGDPVMAMGGFNGSDPWPTLAAFKALVAAGKVRYVLVGGGLGAGSPGAGSLGAGSLGAGSLGAGSPGGRLGPGGSATAALGRSTANPTTGAGLPGSGGFPGGPAGGGFGAGGFPGPGGSGPGGAGPGGPGSGGAGFGGSSTVTAVDQWVEAHGTVVPSRDYGGSGSGTLYVVSANTAR